jgi:hypothetical protein
MLLTRICSQYCMKSRYSHLKVLGAFLRVAPAGLPSVSQSRRGLHATWTILLNHFWLYQSKQPSGVIAIEETDLPREDTPTVLFIHDHDKDLEQCRPLAEKLVRSVTQNSAGNVAVQCLLVDTR